MRRCFHAALGLRQRIPPEPPSTDSRARRDGFGAWGKETPASLDAASSKHSPKALAALATKRRATSFTSGARSAATSCRGIRFACPSGSQQLLEARLPGSPRRRVVEAISGLGLPAVVVGLPARRVSTVGRQEISAVSAQRRQRRHRSDRVAVSALCASLACSASAAPRQVILHRGGERTAASPVPWFSKWPRRTAPLRIALRTIGLYETLASFRLGRRMPLLAEGEGETSPDPVSAPAAQARRAAMGSNSLSSQSTLLFSVASTEPARVSPRSGRH